MTEAATSTTCVVVAKKCGFSVFSVWEKPCIPTSDMARIVVERTNTNEKCVTMTLDYGFEIETLP
jgi:hypothetical protein